ncbi:hypothetical protein FA95DRAFT_1559004 [Auriscalpium vulgare]|uniref:Uncharacterized protein n=1 Tax=Auriscalpium vulgare TaxID=40419 RepID=A0ACB8RU50_9AGAM|nr:hypothetical protein FA95DRAFT_1559004 [Auriscalpium vulgare]
MGYKTYRIKDGRIAPYVPCGRPPSFMAGPARATHPESSVRISQSLPIQRELTLIVLYSAS